MTTPIEEAYKRLKKYSKNGKLDYNKALNALMAEPPIYLGMGPKGMLKVLEALKKIELKPKAIDVIIK
jgi:hypothetical protein